MSPNLLCLGVMLAVGLALGAAYLLWRRHQMQQAMVDSCLLCESQQVAVRDRSGAYACRACGYDTDLELFPGTRRQVEEARDLKNALMEFDAGVSALGWAQFGAVLDLAGGRSAGKYEKMNEATQHMMEGFRLLKDVLKTRPDLLEMPIPGQNISGGLFFADLLMDNVIVNAIMISKVTESKAEVQAFVARLRAIYDALRQEIVQPGNLEAAARYVDRLPKAARVRSFDPKAGLLDGDAADPGLRGDPALKNKLLAPVAAGLVAVALAGVGGWLWLERSARHPERVLVAVRVPSSEAGVWLSRRLSYGLRELGFEPVELEDPEVAAALEGAESEEDLLAVARRFGAAHAILGELRPAARRPLGDDAAVEIALEGDLRIFDADAEAPTAAVPVRRFGAGKSDEDAITEAAQEISERDVSAVLPPLLAHPAVVALEEPSGRGREELEAFEQLRPARGFLKSVGQLQHDRQEALAKLEAGFKEDAPGVASLSPLTHEEYLFGVLPGRQGALIKRDPRVGVLLTRRPDKLLYESPRETIDRVPPAAPDQRKSLADAFNMYSYPGVSADGGLLAYVTTEPAGAGFTLYTLDLRDPAALPIPRIFADDGAPLSSPRPSPDGSSVLFYASACRRCPSALEVLTLASGERRVLADAEAPADDPRWIAPGALTWSQRREDGARRFLRVELGSDLPPEVLLASDVDPPWQDAQLLPSGEALVVVRRDVDGSARLSVFNLSTREYKDLLNADALDRVEISHDGAWAAVEARGFDDPEDRRTRDVEIVAVRLGDGEARAVTRNGVRDRYARWAPDRLDLYFETELDDPLISSPIMITRWVEVAP